jgi:hypothetical protein
MVKPLIAAALALGSVAVVPAAQAQRWYDDAPRYEQPYHGGYYGEPYRGGWEQRGYYQGGYYQGYDRGYRGNRRCDTGATGTVIGALAGGLLGHAVAGRGDHTLGTILGAGAGALAGRAVERSGNPGYCR